MTNAQGAQQLLPISIVLVEDHALTRMVLKSMLERRQDLKIIAEVDNGEEAVKLALELKPKIVLMDVGMPIMDGIEAALKIREKAPHINIIMLTSHDNDEDIFASLAAGAAGYCLKDTAPERLYAAIRWVNAGHVWLDCAIADKVFKKYLSLPIKTNGHVAATAIEPKLPQTLLPEEMAVLVLVAEGLSNQEIADKLIIPLAIANTHMCKILHKLAADDRTLKALADMQGRNRKQLF